MSSVSEYEEGADPTTSPVEFVLLGTKHYSYAMLAMNGTVGQTPLVPERAAEWSQSLNSQAILITDRNLGLDATAAKSIHTDDPGDWKGSVLWGDNHVAFENSHDQFTTKYGNGPLNVDAGGNGIDNLFTSNTAPGFTNAYMSKDDRIVSSGAEN